MPDDYEPKHNETAIPSTSTSTENDWPLQQQSGQPASSNTYRSWLSAARQQVPQIVPANRKQLGDRSGSTSSQHPSEFTSSRPPTITASPLSTKSIIPKPQSPTSVPESMWSPSSSHPPAASAPKGPLFLPSLISPEVASSLPEKYTIRPLQRSDFKAGFLDVLRVLTSVGNIDEKSWVGHYDFMARRDDTYYIVVVADGAGKIVGCGSLVVERKFIHNLGKVGHIEDIAVLKDQQGKKLGLRIIQALDYISEKIGCYKSILDCSEANEGFYVKCGYKRAGLEMAHYYEKPESKPKV